MAIVSQQPPNNDVREIIYNITKKKVQKKIRRQEKTIKEKNNRELRYKKISEIIAANSTKSAEELDCLITNYILQARVKTVKNLNASRNIRNIRKKRM